MLYFLFASSSRNQQPDPEVGKAEEQHEDAGSDDDDGGAKPVLKRPAAKSVVDKEDAPPAKKTRAPRSERTADEIAAQATFPVLDNYRATLCT